MDDSTKSKSGSDQPAGLWRRDWLLSLLLVIVTLLAYLPVWNGTPIWDDDAHLTKPELRSLKGWGEYGLSPALPSSTIRWRIRCFGWNTNSGAIGLPVIIC